MPRDFNQLDWNADVADDCRQLIRLAVREDLHRAYDWTTVSLVPPDATGRAAIVARQAGIVAGLPAGKLVIEEMSANIDWQALAKDGQQVQRGDVLVQLAGSVRDLLTCERTMLNLMGRLCGVATQTGRYVAAVAGTKVRLVDTRKTTPGWRRLEKYAVRCGGGHNHRTGLFDAVLIKDNHLAWGMHGVESQGSTAATSNAKGFWPAEAVTRARQFLAEQATTKLGRNQIDGREMIVEIEVDNLAQLEQVLPAGPDIVLLDNMNVSLLRQAVAMRNKLAPQIELEASGGITLDTIRGVAETGVDRISVGALTHSAICFDLALDWEE